jgi:hypothetical protein
MFASRVSRVAVLILFFAPAESAVAQWTAAVDFDRDYTVLSRFLTEVDAYVVQRYRPSESLSPEFLCLPEDARSSVGAVAEASQVPSPLREGDIFRPDVADLFRLRIAATLRGYDNRAGLLDEMDEQELVVPPIRVNAPLPWGTGNVILPSIADALPPLPEELAYRVLGRDLVLVDMESDLVIDVIRAALPKY